MKKASEPKRIQRKRIKGWRMPINTVYVGRPTDWGNPFSVKEYGREGAIAKYRYWLLTRAVLELEDIRGKNLACWCPLTQPCHADILLEIANEKDDRGSPRNRSM